MNWKIKTKEQDVAVKMLDYNVITYIPQANLTDILKGDVVEVEDAEGYTLALSDDVNVRCRPCDITLIKSEKPKAKDE